VIQEDANMIDKKFIGYKQPPTLWDVEKGRIAFLPT